MGEVYEAEDHELGEHVAIKTLRLDALQQPGALERFKREVHLAKQVTHPNVCRIFDLVRHRSAGAQSELNDCYFLIMELLEGETLAERLKRINAMTMEEAFPIVRQMTSALSAAHNVGILHRDFKPGNIVLVPSEGGIRAVVTDFGLALRSSADFSALLTAATSAAFGTPAYMSPEQLLGEDLTPASDIYALGLVIYEVVTGVRPFSAENSISMAVRRLTEKPTSPKVLCPGLNTQWEQVILKCLQREPQNRFARAKEVAQALTRKKAVSSSRTVRIHYAPVLALMFVLIGILSSFIAYRLLPRKSREVEHAGVPHKLRRSVAVLGFKNLSKRIETDWISTALAETITTELAEGEQLRTIPGEDVARMKISLSLADADTYGEDTLGRIRKNLGADYVMPIDAMCMTMILLVKPPSYPTRRRTISLTPAGGF